MSFAALFFSVSFFVQLYAEDFLDQIMSAENKLVQSMQNPKSSIDLQKSLQTYANDLTIASSIPCKSRNSVNVSSLESLQRALLFGKNYEDDLSKPSVWRPLTALHTTLKQQIANKKITLDHFTKFQNLNKEVLSDFNNSLQDVGYKSYESLTAAVNKNIKQAFWWNIVFRTSIFVGAIGFYQIFSQWHNTTSPFSMHFLKFASLGLASTCGLIAATCNKKNNILVRSQAIKAKYDIYNQCTNSPEWTALKEKLTQSYFVAAFIYRTGFLDLKLDKGSNIEDLNKFVTVAEELLKTLD